MPQVLVDLYKVISIELHSEENRDYVSTTDDVFNRCVTCTNGALMKGDYQALVDSIRECLPLSRKVTFHKDSVKHESISRSDQLTFVELPLSVIWDADNDGPLDDECMFQQHGEIGKQGLGMDVHMLHVQRQRMTSVSFSATVQFPHDTYSAFSNKLKRRHSIVCDDDELRQHLDKINNPLELCVSLSSINGVTLLSSQSGKWSNVPYTINFVI